MKKIKLIHFALWAFVSVIITACEYATEDKYITLPDVVIEDMSATGELPSQIFYGETLRLEPAIQYGNQGAEAFDFKWYKQSYSSLKLLSEQPVFEQVMDSLGVWTIRLEVINKETKISTATTMGVTVVSQNERGWYVLKENAAGNTDMDILRVSKDGTDNGREDDILADKEVTLYGKPVALLYTYNYSWKESWSSSFTSYISTFVPVSERGMASMRINDGRVFAQNEEMFYDREDQLTDAQGGIGVTSQQLVTNGGKAHLMQSGMSAFLPRVPGDYDLSPYFTGSIESSSSSQSYIIGFDRTSRSFVYITPLASKLSNFPDHYVEGDMERISSNNMDGTISFMQNTDGSLNDSIPTYGQRAYALFHENGVTDRCILFGLDLAQIDPSERIHGSAKYSPIMSADTVAYADVPKLRDASVMALHKNFPLLYFVNGHTVSSYYITAKNYRKDVITFPTGEEVTYMHYMSISYDDVPFDCLIIATYMVADGSYKIYRYRIAGDDTRLVGTPYTGRGKVKTMMFSSSNSASWQYQMFRYY